MKLFGIHIYESSEEVGFHKGYSCGRRNTYLFMKDLEKAHKRHPKAFPYEYLFKAVMKNVKIGS